MQQYRAIKRVPKALAQSASNDLEAGLLKNLRHPGIPMVYDVEEDEEAFYIIEEYVQGEPLSDFVQNQDNISQDLAIAYGVQLCGIVEYLHSQQPRPVLYLDFKPEHIIVCGGQLRLIDFGIAVSAEASGNQAQSYGTRGFAAPEQYQGACASRQTDIFGIGAILYYMLTKSALPQPKMESKESKQSLSHLKYCSPILKKIITRALAPQGQRYETVTALRQELEQLGQRQAGAGAIWRAPKKRGPLLLHRRGNQPRQHLLQKIIVAGSQKHIGATHVAISLVSWLNRRAMDSVYQPRDGGNLIREMGRWQDGVSWKQDICCYRNFRGAQADSEAGSAMPYITVEDHGDQLQQVAEELSDLVALVLGGRSWEYAAGLLAYEQLSGEENLVLLCNYGDSAMAAKYARAFGRKVYCYPMEKDPFCGSRQKERLFETMLKEGGG